MSFRTLACVLTFAFLNCMSADLSPDFNRDVRPILSQNCYKCHGMDANARKSKLRLDVRDEALKPAKSNSVAIVPGKPEKSELVTRIESEDSEEVMPPPATKFKLTSAQKEILKKWIAAGAEYSPHWAFVAPRQAALPIPAKNPIDAFIRSRLEREGLKPAAPADRLTLCRRVYLDLIGLPPTPQEADAFVNDAAPDAYEQLVDRLLKSPHYGERWARRWLDLARYADTNGYEKDRPRSIWPYRDWVIQALNADMPFDQFSIKQIAGDLLPHPTPEDLIATGFHRNTMLNEEGGIDPLEFRFLSMVDRVGTTGTAWLGLTLACAQCHTHKYDPIQHHEYYGMMAFLDNADEPDYSIPNAVHDKRRAELLARIAAMEADLPKAWTPQSEPSWLTVTAEGRDSAGHSAEVLADSTLRFRGTVPDKDTYTLTFDTFDGPVDRIRLDVLKDRANGPGRTPHGNFVLNEISVQMTPKDSTARQTLKLVRAEADFSQASFDVAGAIDGDPASGWAIDGGGQPIGEHHAIFYFDRPVVAPKGAHWSVKLVQTFGSGHVIGKLRIRPGRPAERAQPAETDRSAAIDRAFLVWEQAEHARAVKWEVLRPSAIKTNLALLKVLDDGSLLASGDITKSDTYELKFERKTEGIRALRLEVLPDESLPGNGPGRTYYEGMKGDFFLSELHILLNGTRLKPAHVTQSTAGSDIFSSTESSAAQTQDGNMTTGWSVGNATGKVSEAVFAFDPPLSGGALELKMQFERHFACPLGHFRISVTAENPASKLPPEASRHGASIEAILAKPDSERSDIERELLHKRFFQVAPELAAAREQIKRLRDNLPKAETTLVLRERPGDNPRLTYLHHRGEFTQPAERVEASVPAFLPPLPKDAPHNRLGLAQWLVSPENPLTARVTVNRQWQAFFGRGIVKTMEDFGYQGDVPTHPELLDWLAVEFVKEGWSFKRLHRLIVTSETYQQDSRLTPEALQRDPANLLLSRGPRFRMEAELIRDSALSAAGILSEKIGGPGVFPPQPASITTEGAYGQFAWNTSQGEDRHRRSIYTFIKRTAPFAMYTTFDGGSGEACLAKREISNSPLQALTLLNDEMFLEAAQEAARRIVSAPGSDAERAKRAFRRCLIRPPEEVELAAIVQFAAKQREHFALRFQEAEGFAGKAGAEPVERAVWTAVMRSLFNLDEFVTKR